MADVTLMSVHKFLHKLSYLLWVPYTLQIILDLYVPEKELAKNRSQI